MKKSILLLFAALLSTLASAHDFEVNGIYYNITSSTELTVEVTYRGKSHTSYNEYSGVVTIPHTVKYNDEDYSVTAIGEHAFSWCSHLTAINIPESVTSIGNMAFYNCNRLKTINIPEDSQLMSIENYAFKNCRRLTTITFPESMTSIEDYAFTDCWSLTDINIGMTKVGAHAFSSKNYKEFKPHLSVGVAGRFNHYYYYDDYDHEGYGFSLGWNLSGDYHFTPYLGARLTFCVGREPSALHTIRTPWRVGIDCMFDISTLLASYTSHRRLDVALAGGLVADRLGKGVQIGLPIQFHINENWGILLESHTSVLRLGIHNLSYYRSLGVLVGVKYSFK